MVAGPERLSVGVIATGVGWRPRAAGTVYFGNNALGLAVFRAGRADAYCSSQCPTGFES